MGFNDAQLCAINHYRGPAIVLAGPGSGKTTVITHRVKNLIEQYKVSPSEILVITFTKMAAGEMKERFLKLTENKYVAVTFGTFHAVYFTILKHAYNYSADDIISQTKQINLIRELVALHELEISDEKEYAEKILAEISYVKGQRIAVKDYVSKNCPENVFRHVYKDYISTMENKRMIDFDDMLIYCRELFEQRKDILKAWQNKYRFILIDEFQDISDVQYDVIKMLASLEHNIFIVGDDDQSIYSFRGARPEIMLGFEKDYPDAVHIDMNLNYRSTSNIVNGAKSVIQCNKERFDKDIRTVNEEGERIIVRGFEDTEKENEYIADTIIGILKKSDIDMKARGNNSSIAILTRTNAGAGLIIQKLVEKDITFNTKEKILNIFEHWIAQDISAYINLARGSCERSDYLKVINKPLRYISRSSFISPKVDIREVKHFYKDKVWMQERIDEFTEDIRRLSVMGPFAAVNYIRKGIGYDNYIKTFAKEHRINLEELEEIINAIVESTKACRTYEEWFEYIDDYTERLNESSDNSAKDNKGGSNAVNVCTMHASKGLEYDSVFVIDVNEGIIPYKKSVLAEQIEEERRMFYVAMTRAKKRLYLCYTNARFNQKMEMSRFLEEMSEKYTMH